MDYLNQFRFTIDTNDLKNILKYLTPSVGNDKYAPITTMIEIKLYNEFVVFTTTNNMTTACCTYFFNGLSDVSEIMSNVEEQEPIIVSILFDEFSKLLGKITQKEVELMVFEDTQNRYFFKVMTKDASYRLQVPLSIALTSAFQGSSVQKVYRVLDTLFDSLQFSTIKKTMVGWNNKNYIDMTVLKYTMEHDCTTKLSQYENKIYEYVYVDKIASISAEMKAMTFVEGKMFCGEPVHALLDKQTMKQIILLGSNNASYEYNECLFNNRNYMYLELTNAKDFLSGETQMYKQVFINQPYKNIEEQYSPGNLLSFTENYEFSPIGTFDAKKFSEALDRISLFMESSDDNLVRISITGGTENNGEIYVSSIDKKAHDKIVLQEQEPVCEFENVSFLVDVNRLKKFVCSYGGEYPVMYSMDAGILLCNNFIQTETKGFNDEGIVIKTEPISCKATHILVVESTNG